MTIELSPMGVEMLKDMDKIACSEVSKIRKKEMDRK